MQTLTRVTRICVLMTFAWVSLEARSGERPTEETPDRNIIERQAIRGTMDFLNIAEERRRFLIAAGDDTAIDQEEFESDKKRNRGFARVFDTWQALAMFDWEDDGIVHWPDALAYRTRVRELLLQVYDFDADGHLRDDEWKAVQNDLSEELILNLLLKDRRNQKDEREDQSILKGVHLPDPDKDGNGVISQAEWEAHDATEKQRVTEHFERNRKVVLRGFDYNGNGEIEPDEADAFRAWRDDMFKRSFDRNRDGTLDADEFEAFARSALARYISQQRQFDKNNDGLMSYEEMMSYRKEEEAWLAKKIQRDMEEYDAGLKEYAKKHRATFDRNDDGVIDRDEMLPLLKAFDKHLESSRNQRKE